MLTICNVSSTLLFGFNESSVKFTFSYTLKLTPLNKPDNILKAIWNIICYKNTFGMNSIQRHMVVQNMMRAEGRTKFKVVCSVGSACVSGTPNIQTMTTL